MNRSLPIAYLNSLFIFFLASACKPPATPINNGSDVERTGCPELNQGHTLRRDVALPSFVQRAVPVFSQIVTAYKRDLENKHPLNRVEQRHVANTKNVQEVNGQAKFMHKIGL